MKLGTANIRNFPDMRPELVAADTLTIMANTSLCGLQEIQPHEDTPVVLAQLGQRWGLVGGAYETPIIYNAHRWELLDHHAIPFHRPRLPRPESVHGAVVSGVFRSVQRRKLPPFAVVNVHLVAGGYNAERLPVVADRWRVEWGMYQDEALRLWRHGLSVFAVGDLNHPKPPKLRPHGSFTWLSPSLGGADHLGVLENGESVSMRSPMNFRVPLNSDHDLRVISGPVRHAD